jgi:hemoglobin
MKKQSNVHDQILTKFKYGLSSNINCFTRTQMTSSTNDTGYGIKDNSYKAAGCIEGIIKLVDTFYNYVDTLADAKTIRKMYPEDLTISKQKLAYFLSGWLGGPRSYQEHYGSISIPRVHSHMKIGTAQRDAWLFCMKKAVDEQAFSDSFKIYLLEQLSIPAEKIRQVCDLRESGTPPTQE